MPAGPCGSAGQRVDDVYEFFSRVTVLHGVISATNNLDRAQTRKDFLLYRPQSEISRVKWDVRGTFMQEMYDFQVNLRKYIIDNAMPRSQEFENLKQPDVMIFIVYFA